jgi:hypothetical protein
VLEVNVAGDLVGSGRQRGYVKTQEDLANPMVETACSIASRRRRGDQLEIGDGAGKLRVATRSSIFCDLEEKKGSGRCAWKRGKRLGGEGVARAHHRHRILPGMPADVRRFGERLPRPRSISGKGAKRERGLDVLGYL